MVENWDVKEKLSPIIGDIKTNIPLLMYSIVDLTPDMFDRIGKLISDGHGEIKIEIPSKNAIVTLRKVEK